jgi:hypothetical protein
MWQFQRKNSSVLLASTLCSPSTALEAQWQIILDYTMCNGQSYRQQNTRLCSTSTHLPLLTL